METTLKCSDCKCKLYVWVPDGDGSDCAVVPPLDKPRYLYVCKSKKCYNPYSDKLFIVGIHPSKTKNKRSDK